MEEGTKVSNKHRRENEKTPQNQRLLHVPVIAAAEGGGSVGRGRNRSWSRREIVAIGAVKGNHLGGKKGNRKASSSEEGNHKSNEASSTITSAGRVRGKRTVEELIADTR